MMAARQFPRFEQLGQSARIAQMPPRMALATLNWERITLKWRDLAERRRRHYIELFESGRWKRYYSDAKFLNELRAAIIASNHWAKIAPHPEESAGETAAPPEPAAMVVPPAVQYALPPAA
jgi:uncharacterized repeat protein (TIGR03809 family)